MVTFKKTGTKHVYKLSDGKDEWFTYEDETSNFSDSRYTTEIAAEEELIRYCNWLDKGE